MCPEKRGRSLRVMTRPCSSADRASASGAVCAGSIPARGAKGEWL